MSDNGETQERILSAIEFIGGRVLIERRPWKFPDGDTYEDAWTVSAAGCGGAANRSLVDAFDDTFSVLVRLADLDPDHFERFATMPYYGRSIEP